MNIIKLDKDVVVYQHILDPSGGMTMNTIAVFDGDEFVLIDTGYQHHMKGLKNELDFSKCKYIMITHHHPDHTFGAKELKGIDIIGHKDYKTGFDECVEWGLITDWTIDKTVPTIFMEDREIFTFGKHSFEFIHNPLHTKSGMLINLNNEYLFVGDELLSTLDGEDITCVFLAKNELSDNPFELLLECAKGKTVIPGHGPVMNGDISDFVKKRTLYASLVKKGVSFDDLEKNGFKCRCYRHFHEKNLELHYKDS